MVLADSPTASYGMMALIFFSIVTHRLRGGLYSFAPSELLSHLLGVSSCLGLVRARRLRCGPILPGRLDSRGRLSPHELRLSLHSRMVLAAARRLRRRDGPFDYAQDKLRPPLHLRFRGVGSRLWRVACRCWVRSRPRLLLLWLR